MMKPTVREITIAVGGLVVGTTIGYFVANKRASIQLKAHLDAMDAMYEDSLSRIQKTGPYATVDDAAAVLIPEKPLGLDVDDSDDEASDEEDIPDDEVANDEADYRAWNARAIAEESHIPKHLTKDYQTESEPTVDDEDPAAARNLKAFVEKYQTTITIQQDDEFAGVNFPGKTDDDDDTPEPTVPGFVTVRDPNGPYVISIDEYMEDDSPFTKVELTYFDGDDTLIDSRQQMIPDIEKTIGRKNLEKWGQGTTDPDQVYIRNERLEIDIEVTKDDRTYTRVILGIVPEDEVARSMIKPQKMRDGDDN